STCVRTPCRSTSSMGSSTCASPGTCRWSDTRRRPTWTSRCRSSGASRSRTSSSALRRRRFRLGDLLGHAIAILTRRRHGHELLPRCDGAGRTALQIVEDLAAVEERRWIVRIDGERAVEEPEAVIDELAALRAVRAHHQQQAEVGERVHVLRIALEDRLIRGRSLLRPPREEALARRL